MPSCTLAPPSASQHRPPHAHALPRCLPCRVVIIRTLPYTPVEMVQILAVRAQVEGISIDEESLAYMGELGEATSLRWAGRARLARLAALAMLLHAGHAVCIMHLMAGHVVYLRVHPLHCERSTRGAQVCCVVSTSCATHMAAAGLNVSPYADNTSSASCNVACPLRKPRPQLLHLHPCHAAAGTWCSC